MFGLSILHLLIIGLVVFLLLGGRISRAMGEAGEV